MGNGKLRYQRYARYVRHRRYGSAPVPPAPKPTVTKKADITGKLVGDTVLFSDLFVVADGKVGDLTVTVNNGATVNSSARSIEITAAGVTTVTAKVTVNPTSTATATVTATAPQVP